MKDSPALGQLVSDDGERVQCHICGRWFIYLTPHLRWKHNLTCDEYREDFGLNRTQPLCSESLSEKHRRHFIAAGLVGKHLCFNLSDFPHATERRLQGRLNFSRARKGVRIRGSERRKESQRRNYQMTRVPEPCVVCGTVVLVHKIRGKSALCDKCRPAWRKEYNHRWADANRRHLREYWQDYDRNRRHKVAAEHDSRDRRLKQPAKNRMPGL